MKIPDIFVSSLESKGWQPFGVGEVHIIRDDGKGKLKAGLWRVTPEQAQKSMTVPCHQDETVFIISGHITIETSEGETHELKAGSCASFVKGAVHVWTVREPSLEFFVYT